MRFFTTVSVGTETDFLALYSARVWWKSTYIPESIWAQRATTGRYGLPCSFTRIPCFALFLCRCAVAV